MKFVSSFGGVNLPCGIAVDKNDVFIANTTMGETLVIDLNTKKTLYQCKTSRQGYQPVGMAVSNDKIFITDSTLMCLDIYKRHTGELLQSIGHGGKKPLQFGGGDSYLCIFGEELFITDCLNHRIQVLDLQGNFLREFGEEGQAEGKLRKPAGIVVTEEEVYITEYSNGRISVFTRDGKFLRCWGNLSAPIGVTLFVDELWVAETDPSRIQVFR